MTTKDTEPQKTRLAFTWFGIIAGAVVAGYLIWTTILILQGVAGDKNIRDLWNGWMFGSGIALWLLPIRRKDEDIGKKFKCRRSWNWWFETISLFLLILFVTFINVSIYAMRIVGSTDISVVFFLAMAIGITTALLCAGLQALHDAGYMVTVYVFVMILAIDALPIPRGSAGTNVLAGASIFTLLVLGVIAQRFITMIFRDIHEDILTGMTLAFASLFVFEGYEKWVDRSFAEQGFAFLLIFIISLTRVGWAFIFAKLDGTKRIEAALYKSVPVTIEGEPKVQEEIKNLNEDMDLEGSETGYLLDYQSTSSYD
jgi:hypothetical protein